MLAAQQFASDQNPIIYIAYKKNPNKQTNKQHVLLAGVKGLEICVRPHFHDARTKMQHGKTKQI